MEILFSGGIRDRVLLAILIATISAAVVHVIIGGVLDKLCNIERQLSDNNSKLHSARELTQNR